MDDAKLLAWWAGRQVDGWTCPEHELCWWTRLGGVLRFLQVENSLYWTISNALSGATTNKILIISQVSLVKYANQTPAVPFPDASGGAAPNLKMHPMSRAALGLEPHAEE